MSDALEGAKNEEKRTRKNLRGLMTSHERARMDIGDFVEAGLDRIRTYSDTHPLLVGRSRRPATMQMISDIETLIESVKTATPSDMKQLQFQALTYKKALTSVKIDGVDIEDIEILQYANLLLEALGYAKKTYVSQRNVDSMGFGSTVFSTIFGDKLGTWLLSTPKSDIQNKSIAEIHYSLAKSKTQQIMSGGTSSLPSPSYGDAASPSDLSYDNNADVSAEEREGIAESQIRQAEVEQKEDKVITLLERILLLLENRDASDIGGADGSGEDGEEGAPAAAGSWLDSLLNFAVGGGVGLGVGAGPAIWKRLSSPRWRRAALYRMFPNQTKAAAAVRAARAATGVGRWAAILRIAKLGTLITPAGVLIEIVNLALTSQLEQAEEETRKHMAYITSGFTRDPATGDFRNWKGSVVTTHDEIVRKAAATGLAPSDVLGRAQLKNNEDEIIDELKKARDAFSNDDDSLGVEHLHRAKDRILDRGQLARNVKADTILEAKNILQMTPDNYTKANLLLHATGNHIGPWETRDSESLSATRYALDFVNPKLSMQKFRKMAGAEWPWLTDDLGEGGKGFRAVSQPGWRGSRRRTLGDVLGEMGFRGADVELSSIPDYLEADTKQQHPGYEVKKETWDRKPMPGKFIKGDIPNTTKVQSGVPVTMLNNMSQLQENMALQQLGMSFAGPSSSGGAVLVQGNTNSVNNSMIVSDGVVEDKASLNNRERDAFLRSQTFSLV